MPMYEFDPGPISGLRKRVLAKQLTALRERDKLFQLQVEREPLFSLRASLSSEQMANKAAMMRLSDSMAAIEQQNAASREAEAAFKRLTPLQRASRSRGLYRSGQDRNAAIAGFLERERRRVAPLSREAMSRAKAIAAARGRFDIKSGYRRGARVPGVSSSFGPEHLRGVDVSRADVDPCVEYRARQVIRRNVMFAKGYAGRGYRTSHRWNPC